MLPPEWFNNDLTSDVFQLLWIRDPVLEAAVSGSDVPKGWMKAMSTHNPRKYTEHGRGLGLGLIHWDSHLRAIRTNWILKYLDSTLGPWKQILDQWFAKYTPIGRDHVLSALPTNYLTEMIGTGRPALPAFWKQALEDARFLELKPLTTTLEGAEGQPVFYNPNSHLSDEAKNTKTSGKRSAHRH